VSVSTSRWSRSPAALGRSLAIACVGQRRVASGQRRVVLGLARLEADVLEHHDVAVGNIVEVGRERDVGVEQLAQPGRDGRQGVVEVPALRPPEVGGQEEPRAAAAQLLQGRQGGPDPRVVADDAVAQRDVEVDADEDALAGQVAEVVEGSQRTFWMRSATRLE